MQNIIKSVEKSIDEKIVEWEEDLKRQRLHLDEILDL